MEPRLQKRFAALVLQHLRAASPHHPGLARLPQQSSQAAAQAAWRFFSNPRVALPQLAQPLLDCARQAVAQLDADFVLAAHDWSFLHYPTHSSKADQTQLSHDRDIGYELATVLLVDPKCGNPLAPVELRLRADGAVYSTRQPAPPAHAYRLDQVRPSMRAVAALGLARPVVHVIDSEADSVAHLRAWQRDGRLFLLRSDGCRLARWQGQEMLLSAVAGRLVQAGQLHRARQVSFEGRRVQQWVGEAEVVLHRPAQQHRRRGRGGRRRRREQRRRVPGRPLALRLVVAQLRDEQGAVLAEWLLLSNVPAAVPAAVLALWYCFRWRIESYHQLVKSGGQQLESWQQETAERLARRLVVASMACVVVWQLAGQEGDEASWLRDALMRLSGRQHKRGVGWTLPGLLAGYGVVLAWASLSRLVGPAGMARLEGLVSGMLPEQRDTG